MQPSTLTLLIISILSPLKALGRSVALDGRAPGIPAVVLANNGTDETSGTGSGGGADDGEGAILRTRTPQCVNGAEHPEWSSQAGKVGPAACVSALAAIQRAAGPDVRAGHLFYSSKTFPRWPPQPGAISLPKGHMASVMRGNCVFVVRMKNDFARDALPLAAGGYLDPRDLPVQTRTWAEVFEAATAVLSSCVRRTGVAMAGWDTVGNDESSDHEGLVVAFWPRNSIMDLMYGPEVDNVTGNDTVLELSPQQTA